MSDALNALNAPTASKPSATAPVISQQTAGGKPNPTPNPSAPTQGAFGKSKHAPVIATATVVNGITYAEKNYVKGDTVTGPLHVLRKFGRELTITAPASAVAAVRPPPPGAVRQRRPVSMLSASITPALSQ